MSLRTLFARALDLEPVTSVRVLPTWQRARPLPAPDEYNKLAQGYRQQVVIAGCVWAIATSAAEPKLVIEDVKSTGEAVPIEDPNHPLVRLLGRPNPEQSTYTMLETLFTYQQIMGNWLLRKLRNKSGMPVQVWPVLPSQVKVVLDANGLVKQYQYTPDPKNPILAQDMIHDPLHSDPSNEFWGLSPLAIVARWADVDEQATEFIRAFFNNDATPSGILKLKARTLPAERERIRDLWTQQHTKGSGWHSVSVLDADADYQAIGSTPSRLQMDNLFSRAESRICMAFGVPPIVVGAQVGLDRSTFSNYSAARAAFWKDTLAPLYRRAGERLTIGLAHEFGSTLRIRFDLSTVEALQEDRNQIRTLVITAFERNLMTRNEARRLIGLGLEQLPKIEGDQYYSDMSTPIEEMQTLRRVK